MPTRPFDGLRVVPSKVEGQQARGKPPMTDLAKNILYEDEDIVVLNKPAGLVVHPDGRTEEPSVSGWFGKKYPKSRDVGERLGNIERPGIVHRIDRETSGVLLLAKTKIGHKVLKEQFQKREIGKIYHLFVYGNLKDNQGIIDLPIARSVSNFRKWSAERGARGEKREAVTYFQVLKRLGDKSATFVEAKPKTGRTHQIRVHFKALHHPIVCDKLYAPSKPCLLGFSRLALHARTITFKIVSGKQVTIEAPYPEDFVRAMDMMD
ncbi:MAG: RluA family pseudouridine synthase [Patescibacteria group bacterium]|nr:RluA family pseudouridine synthase [Patescibacteria group bacterium]